MARAIMEPLAVWMRQTRNWRVISLRSMFSKFLSRLTTPYEGNYITALNADPVQLGLVKSFSSVAGTLFSTPVGWLQDRYSLRKIFLIGVSLSMAVMFIYASVTDWVMLIPAMFLSALAMKLGSCVTICDVSLQLSKDRSTCKGMCDGVFSALSLIAPIMAAFVVTSSGGIDRAEGIRPLYWIQLAGSFILFTFLVIQLKEIDRPKSTRRAGFIEEHREVFRAGMALKRWILFSVLYAFMTGMDPNSNFTYLFASKVKEADPFVLAGMATAGPLTQVIFSVPLGKLADRIGRKPVLFIVEPLWWASSLLLVFAPMGLWELLIFSSVLGIFRQIVHYVSVTPLMVSLVPLGSIGRWRGILGLFDGLIAIPAPIVGGIVWETLGPAYTLLIPVAIDAFIRMPILTTIPERFGPKAKGEASGS